MTIPVRFVEDSERVYCSFPFDRMVLKYLHARLPEEGMSRDAGLGWQKELGCFVFRTEDWPMAETAIAHGLNGQAVWECCDNTRQFSPTLHEILKGLDK